MHKYEFELPKSDALFRGHGSLEAANGYLLACIAERLERLCSILAFPAYDRHERAQAEAAVYQQAADDAAEDAQVEDARREAMRLEVEELFRTPRVARKKEVT